MAKRKKKRRYKFKNIFLLILFIVIIIKLILMIPIDNKKNVVKKENINKKPYLNNIKKDKEFYGTVDKDIEKLVINYMDKYFKSMTTLKEVDMKNLFSSDSYEEYYINKTAISTLIEIRKLERNDMKISKASYDIIYKKIEKQDDKITLTFLENDYLHFNFMKNIESKVYGIENTITVKKINGSYKILSYRKIQDYYIMITEKYKIGKNKKDVIKELDDIKEKHTEDYKKQLKIIKSQKKKFEQGKNKPIKKCDHSYNRKKALDYAKKYVVDRNPKWDRYDGVGGNCQNFASQTLYNGGIPMDIYGDAESQWKHYGSEINEKNSRVGRSSSWTTAPYFYKYAKNNKGFGLCSLVDINPFYAEPGDIGQVGFDEYYRHSVIIIGYIKDKNNKITDLLINSNSTNLENYPLSGYVYPYKRIIKIFGWNDN